MRILAVSAHPDDETIGAGGTLLRHVERGDRVFWVIVTQPYEPQWTAELIRRAAEQVSTVKDLFGIKEVFRLGFPTVRLNTVPYMELSSALQRVVDEVAPEIVYIPPRDDINTDHRIVHDTALVATRPLPGCSVKTVLSYEISTTSRYGLPSGASPFRPSVFVDISRYLERKEEIFRAYETEVRNFPHPRSLEGITVIAKERGLSVGLDAAECFELVRHVVDSRDMNRGAVP